MAKQIVLNVDWPGYSAGTTLTLGADGVHYFADDGKFFVEASVAESDLVNFQPSPDQIVGQTFYVVSLDEAGNVAVTPVDVTDSSLIQPTWYPTEDLANQAAKKIQDSLNQNTPTAILMKRRLIKP